MNEVKEAIESLIRRIMGDRAVAAEVLEPLSRPGEKGVGLEQPLVEAGIERQEETPHEPHVVVQRQPARLQTFMLQTSVLRTLTPDLCRAVTGFEDARQILRTLADENLFVLPLEGMGEWYRYHQLFRDLLRRQLDRSATAEEIATLLERDGVDGLVTLPTIGPCTILI